MHDYKGFMLDFCIAERFGVKAVKDTFKRAFAEWKDNVEYFASLVLTLNLNHRIWALYKTNDEMTRVYNDLWMKADRYGQKHFKCKAAEFNFSFLD